MHAFYVLCGPASFGLGPAAPASMTASGQAVTTVGLAAFSVFLGMPGMYVQTGVGAVPRALLLVYSRVQQFECARADRVKLDVCVGGLWSRVFGRRFDQASFA